MESLGGTSLQLDDIECSRWISERGFEVKRTHDHPWLKGHLPEDLRVARRLTKIEGGLSKHNDAGEVSIDCICAVPVDPSLYVVSKFPHIYLQGTQTDIERLLVRIDRLFNSILGFSFLQCLEGQQTKKILSLREWKGITQIIVFYPDGPIEENPLPLEWITSENRTKCDVILDEIEKGTGVITIASDHPQKEEILEILQKLSMRPSGAALLRRIHEFREKGVIKIAYKEGKNNCSSPSDLSDETCVVHLDLNASSEYKSSLDKNRNAYINISKWAEGTVAHELIHALHRFLRKFENEVCFSLDHLLDGTIFLADEGRYQIECDSIQLYARHTNYEEQRTILGVPGDPNPSCSFTENSVRYEWFEPLRIEHEVRQHLYRRPFSSHSIIHKNPFQSDAFTLDDLQIAIRKREELAAFYFLQKMNRREVNLSLKSMIEKTSKLQLGERVALYAVIEKGIEYKKLFATFPISQLSALVFSKMEKEDVRDICLLLRHRVTTINLQKAQNALKQLHSIAATYRLSSEELLLNRLINRVKSPRIRISCHAAL